MEVRYRPTSLLSNETRDVALEGAFWLRDCRPRFLSRRALRGFLPRLISLDRRPAPRLPGPGFLFDSPRLSIQPGRVIPWARLAPPDSTRGARIRGRDPRFRWRGALEAGRAGLSGAGSSAGKFLSHGGPALRGRYAYFAYGFPNTFYAKVGPLELAQLHAG
jgi:hypothetical protein